MILSKNETQLALPLVTDPYQDAIQDVMCNIVQRHSAEMYRKRVMSKMQAKTTNLARAYGMGADRLREILMHQ